MDAHRHGCTYVLGLRIVVPTALRRPSCRLLRQRHSGALQTLRRLLGQLSRQRPPLVDLSILDYCIFSHRLPRTLFLCSSNLLHAASATFRQKATLDRLNGNGQATGHTDAFILAKSHTFLRKQAQPKVHNQKAETTLRRSRGNLASCPGFGVFVWWRGLSVWSFVQRATLSFTCDTSLNREETCLLVLAALLFCRRSVASAVPSRLRPGFLGIYPLLSGRQPKNWPCTVLFLASLVEYLLWGVLDCVQCP